MNINFMTGSKYEKDSSHVKLMIIDKDGNSYIANRSSDGGNMREKYGLDFYDKNHRCEYHIDYLQVLLKRYFSVNTKMTVKKVLTLMLVKLDVR